MKYGAITPAKSKKATFDQEAPYFRTKKRVYPYNVDSLKRLRLEEPIEVSEFLRSYHRMLQREREHDKNIKKYDRARSWYLKRGKNATI